MSEREVQDCCLKCYMFSSLSVIYGRIIFQVRTARAKKENCCINAALGV